MSDLRHPLILSPNAYPVVHENPKMKAETVNSNALKAYLDQFENGPQRVQAARDLSAIALAHAMADQAGEGTKG
jgi:hypothetical protein